MTAETWTIIGTGIVILLAIATSNRSMRAEMRAERAERIASSNEMRTEIKELRVEVHDGIDRVESSLTERINRLEMTLRERLARVEGLFEGIRDSLLSQKVA